MEVQRRNGKNAKTTIHNKFNKLKIITITNPLDPNEIIQDAIKDSEKDFIIAGGDGTVNLFINKLIGVLLKIKILRIYE